MADAFDPQHGKRLEDPARLEALPQAAVVELLRLSGAETVVDYGAGTGIYTVAVAAARARRQRLRRRGAAAARRSCCARRSRPSSRTG